MQHAVLATGSHHLQPPRGLQSKIVHIIGFIQYLNQINQISAPIKNTHPETTFK